jgi:hypothetical protein
LLLESEQLAAVQPTHSVTKGFGANEATAPVVALTRLEHVLSCPVLFATRYTFLNAAVTGRTMEMNATGLERFN